MTQVLAALLHPLEVPGIIKFSTLAIHVEKFLQVLFHLPRVLIKF